MKKSERPLCYQLSSRGQNQSSFQSGNNFYDHWLIDNWWFSNVYKCYQPLVYLCLCLSQTSFTDDPFTSLEYDSSYCEGAENAFLCLFRDLLLNFSALFAPLIAQSASVEDITDITDKTPFVSKIRLRIHWSMIIIQGQMLPLKKRSQNNDHNWPTDFDELMCCFSFSF